MRFRKLHAAALVALGLCTSVKAVPLYSENFDVDHTANWAFNTANPTADAANFFFDYSSVGIPSAPGSGGTTRGLMVQANNFGVNIFSGGSASPVLGTPLPSEYVLRAYVWQNTLGPFPAGGSGSTQLTNMAVGVTGTNDEFAGGTETGVQGGVTGDGGSSSDSRALQRGLPGWRRLGHPPSRAPHRLSDHKPE